MDRDEGIECAVAAGDFCCQQAPTLIDPTVLRFGPKTGISCVPAGNQPGRSEGSGKSFALWKLLKHLTERVRQSLSARHPARSDRETGGQASSCLGDSRL